MHFAELAHYGKARAVFCSLAPMMNGGKLKRNLTSFFMSFTTPHMMNKHESPADLLVEGKAELMHNCKNQLSQIIALTLVVAGGRDYFCPV